MAMNRVQFQAGMSLPAFMAKFGTEAQCRSVLFRARWPDGFRCPACESAEYSTFTRERQTYYQCSGCRHQTTLLAGTLFEATKLPLTIWYLALHLLSSAKTNLSALELKRQLGVEFGHGFFSAGITELFAPSIAQIENDAVQTFVAAAVGGTISELSGGKFVNGAVTSAFAWAFNNRAHSMSSKRNRNPDQGGFTQAQLDLEERVYSIVERSGDPNVPATITMEEVHVVT